MGNNGNSSSSSSRSNSSPQHHPVVVPPNQEIKARADQDMTKIIATEASLVDHDDHDFVQHMMSPPTKMLRRAQSLVSHESLIQLRNERWAAENKLLPSNKLATSPMDILSPPKRRRKKKKTMMTTTTSKNKLYLKSGSGGSKETSYVRRSLSTNDARIGMSIAFGLDDDVIIPPTKNAVFTDKSAPQHAGVEEESSTRVAANLNLPAMIFNLHSIREDAGGSGSAGMDLQTSASGKQPLGTVPTGRRSSMDTSQRSAGTSSLMSSVSSTWQQKQQHQAASAFSQRGSMDTSARSSNSGLSSSASHSLVSLISSSNNTTTSTSLASVFANSKNLTAEQLAKFLELHKHSTSQSSLGFSSTTDRHADTTSSSLVEDVPLPAVGAAAAAATLPPPPPCEEDDDNSMAEDSSIDASGRISYATHTSNRSKHDAVESKKMSIPFIPSAVQEPKVESRPSNSSPTKRRAEKPAFLSLKPLPPISDYRTSSLGSRDVPPVPPPHYMRSQSMGTPTQIDIPSTVTGLSSSNGNDRDTILTSSLRTSGSSSGTPRAVSVGPAMMLQQPTLSKKVAPMPFGYRAKSVEGLFGGSSSSIATPASTHSSSPRKSSGGGDVPPNPPSTSRTSLHSSHTSSLSSSKRLGSSGEGSNCAIGKALSTDSLKSERSIHEAIQNAPVKGQQRETMKALLLGEPAPPPPPPPPRGSPGSLSMHRKRSPRQGRRLSKKAVSLSPMPGASRKKPLPTVEVGSTSLTTSKSLALLSPQDDTKSSRWESSPKPMSRKSMSKWDDPSSIIADVKSPPKSPRSGIRRGSRKSLASVPVSGIGSMPHDNGDVPSLSISSSNRKEKASSRKLGAGTSSDDGSATGGSGSGSGRSSSRRRSSRHGHSSASSSSKTPPKPSNSRRKSTSASNVHTVAPLPSQEPPQQVSTAPPRQGPSGRRKQKQQSAPQILSSRSSIGSHNSTPNQSMHEATSAAATALLLETAASTAASRGPVMPPPPPPDDDDEEEYVEQTTTSSLFSSA